MAEIAPNFAKFDDQVSFSGRFAVAVGRVTDFAEMVLNTLRFHFSSLPRLSMQSTNCMPKAIA